MRPYCKSKKSDPDAANVEKCLSSIRSRTTDAGAATAVLNHHTEAAASALRLHRSPELTITTEALALCVGQVMQPGRDAVVCWMPR